MFIHKVCNALDKGRVPYAIVGGYAVSLHGAIRATFDIDFVIEWSHKNLKNTEEALKKISLVSQIPVNSEMIFNNRTEYIEKRNLIAWNFSNPKNYLEQVDLIISYDLSNAKVKVIHTEYGNIKILSLKDLITMKKQSGRPQDLEDIHVLEKLR